VAVFNRHAIHEQKRMLTFFCFRSLAHSREGRSRAVDPHSMELGEQVQLRLDTLMCATSQRASQANARSTRETSV
jgi:hypothetical protein